LEVAPDPTQNGQYFERYRGDDWTLATGKALTWNAPAGAWPDLTRATVTLTARDRETDIEQATVTATVVTAGTGAQAVTASIALPARWRVWLACCKTGAAGRARLRDAKVTKDRVAGVSSPRRGGVRHRRTQGAPSAAAMSDLPGGGISYLRASTSMPHWW
jgi:hypothetical protein